MPSAFAATSTDDTSTSPIHPTKIALAARHEKCARGAPKLLFRRVFLICFARCE